MFGFGSFSFRRKKNLTKGEVTSSKPVSVGYHAPHGNSVYFHHEDRPQFSLLAAEYMRFDPKVTLGLATRNGLLLNAKVKVEADREDVKVFVEKQWEKIWARGGSQILRTKEAGYAGFEIMYQQQDRGPFAGKIVFNSLKDFHPADTRPLIRRSKVVGLTLRRIRRRKFAAATTGRGIPIWSPKTLWLTFRRRHGHWFGESLLEHSYAPWFEKWMRGGAIKLRQLRMVKDAWIGDRILYPSQGLEDQEGNILNWRDMAREAAEMRVSGGVMGFPSDRNSEGNLKVEYMPPTSVEGATEIFNYSNELDKEILQGIETPSEVLEAASSGSGFSGRSIPFVSFLAILQEEFADYVEQIDEQALQSLVSMNFGSDTFYTITPVSLIERIGELMGDGQSTGAGGSRPGQFDSGRNPGEMGSGARAGQSPTDGFESNRGAGGRFGSTNGRDALFAGANGSRQFSEGNGSDRLSWLFNGPQTEGYKPGAIPTAGLKTDVVKGELIYQFADEIPLGSVWVPIGKASSALVDHEGSILKGPQWTADAGITNIADLLGNEQKAPEAAAVGDESESQGVPTNIAVESN